MSRPLVGRVALVTGVSRPQGIAYTLADRLADLGATVIASGWPRHDQDTAGAPDPIRGQRFEIEERDLEEPDTPAALIDDIVARHGAIDIVLAAHPRRTRMSLANVTSDELDRSWAINVRSIVLLAQRFAERHDLARPGGRLIWFTSGQHLGPMPDELPYAITKGALHQMTSTVAALVVDVGIIANCINPGPVDTGYATGRDHELIRRRFPSGRWGVPTDVANLVEFLVRDEGASIQGQVIDSEGGFRR